MEHFENDLHHGSALKVNNGIEQPPSLNPKARQQFKNLRKHLYPIEIYVDGILNGDKTLLGQAITLIESQLPLHQEMAQKIIEKCLPHSGLSIRIGITGVPGVGKSTFIDSFGMFLVSQNRKLAVLAIDPSSERSGGSILGDKTRMLELATNENAFIRPSPSSGELGGVARKTRETIILCEAAGFDTIFIETVGVGQSETAVHSMVDFFLLLMLSGAGDELQGIKRGIMEMADALVITKSDGSNVEKARLAKIEYQNALHLFPLPPSEWKPETLLCSALEKSGISEIWEIILRYIKHTQENGYFSHKRSEQSKYWMHQTINESLKNHFYLEESRKNQILYLEKLVEKGEISSFQAANQLLEEYFISK